MKVGDSVIFIDPYTRISRTCEIARIDGYVYDVLLPEKNVMLEYIYRSAIDDQPLKKEDYILYIKNGTVEGAVIAKVDHISESAQIRTLVSKVHISNLYNVPLPDEVNAASERVNAQWPDSVSAASDRLNAQWPDSVSAASDRLNAQWPDYKN